MVETKIIYQGQKHCELTHGPSGTKISTDAPKDNQGKGESFSPTDLVAAALGSCILTTMAIVADRDGVSMAGAHASVEKHMNDNPRRIGSLVVRISLPATLTAEQRKKLELFAAHCPVHRSLHPDMKIPVEFSYF